MSSRVLVWMSVGEVGGWGGRARGKEGETAEGNIKNGVSVAQPRVDVFAIVLLWHDCVDQTANNARLKIALDSAYARVQKLQGDTYTRTHAHTHTRTHAHTHTRTHAHTHTRTHLM